MKNSPAMSDEVFICRQCHHPIDAVPGAKSGETLKASASHATKTVQSSLGILRKSPSRRNSREKDKWNSPNRKKTSWDCSVDIFNADSCAVDYFCTSSPIKRTFTEDLESSEEFDNLSEIGDSGSEIGHFSLCQDCYFGDFTARKDSGIMDIDTRILHASEQFSVSELQAEWEKGCDLFNASIVSKDSAIDIDCNLSFSDNESAMSPVHSPKSNCQHEGPRNLDHPNLCPEMSAEPITLSRVIHMQSYLGKYVADLKRESQDLAEKLRQRKRYYDQLVDKWFWKNTTVLQTEFEKEVQEVIEMTKVLQQMQSEMTQTKQNKQGRNRNSSPSKLTALMNEHETEINAARHNWQKLGFLIGQTFKLDFQCLGPIVPHRHDSVIPESQHRSNTDMPEKSQSDDFKKLKVDISKDFFPSKCLYQFDTRKGREFEYLATGLSLMTNGDIIVTDSGRNCVQIFSSLGAQQKRLEISPDVHPTKAVQFRENTIAVSSADGVRLYDSCDGTFCDRQLCGVIDRPQGLAVNRSGDLLVSGYRANIPAVCTYDRQNRRLKNTIFGETLCVGAEEDEAGIFPEQLTNHTIFSNAWYLSVDLENNILISCRDEQTIKTVSSLGDSLDEFGSSGANVGQFLHPAGTCVDNSGNIIVCDSQNHRVQVVVPDQQMALVILSEEHDGIECPMDVALSKDGVLFVLQGNGVVKAFKYS